MLQHGSFRRSRKYVSLGEDREDEEHLLEIIVSKGKGLISLTNQHLWAVRSGPPPEAAAPGCS